MKNNRNLNLKNINLINRESFILSNNNFVNDIKPNNKNIVNNYSLNNKINTIRLATNLISHEQKNNITSNKLNNIFIKENEFYLLSNTNDDNDIELLENFLNIKNNKFDYSINLNDSDNEGNFNISTRNLNFKKENIKEETYKDNNNIRDNLNTFINTSSIIKYINDGVPLHFSEITEVVRNISRNITNNNVVNINITLKPLNLGDINISFSLTENNKMSIVFETSTLAAQKAIESYFNTFKSIVKDNSLTLHELSVSYSPTFKPISSKDRTDSNTRNNLFQSDSSSRSSYKGKKRKKYDSEGDEIKIDI
jgi:hypothetical protein